jgi:Cu/Zn superoxide dismutase
MLRAMGSEMLRLLKNPGGVKVTATVTGLAGNAGEHGIHIHAVGQCTPDFSAAGGHFNPTNAQHGLNNPAGPHGGDGPNLQLADGSATYEVVNDRVTLGSGPNSLFDADGSALVVHAGPDDQVTDPSGNSGDRIACGVIVAGPAAAPAELPQSGGVDYLPLILILLGCLLFSGGALLRRARLL